MRTKLAIVTSLIITAACVGVAQHKQSREVPNWPMLRVFPEPIPGAETAAFMAPDPERDNTFIVTRESLEALLKSKFVETHVTIFSTKPLEANLVRECIHRNLTQEPAGLPRDLTGGERESVVTDVRVER